MTDKLSAVQLGVILPVLDNLCLYELRRISYEGNHFFNVPISLQIKKSQVFLRALKYFQ